MMLKVVTYVDDVHQGFKLYEMKRLYVEADKVTLEGCGDGSITIALDFPETHAVLFFIMNDAGDTIDKFRSDWLSGSAARTARVIAAAERLGSLPEATAVIQAEDGRSVVVGRTVRESGSIATTIDVSPGDGPVVLFSDQDAGRLASALLRGPFAV